MNKIIVKGIKNINGLNYMHLSDAGIKSMSEYKDVLGKPNNNVVAIDMDNNKIRTIRHIENSYLLKYLNLSSNMIRKIKGLTNLPALETLYLHKNRISKIENLECLINLDLLYMVENNIKEIEGLSTLTNLGYLNLGFNPIDELKNLETLVELRELHMMDCKIRRIEGLRNNKKLNRLVFSGNQISKIENISHLCELERFDLSFNNIVTIEGIEDLHNLRELNLIGNPLKYITRASYDFIVRGDVKVELSDMNSVMELKILDEVAIGEIVAEREFLNDLYFKSAEALDDLYDDINPYFGERESEEYKKMETLFNNETREEFREAMVYIWHAKKTFLDRIKDRLR